jgi:multisubunit Na+/H+ antiporter MnhB subunit
MKDLLSAVIGVGVVGMGLAIVFLLLGAPDIAITQVVVEVIVVTVLIRATGRTERREPDGPRPDLPVIVVGSVSLLAVLAFFAAAFLALPAFGSDRVVPALWYLRHAPALTGATNVVTAILLDFRAYDTLGEATVILAAVVGTLAVLRPGAKPRVTAEPPPASDVPRPVAREREVTRG